MLESMVWADTCLDISAATASDVEIQGNKALWPGMAVAGRVVLTILYAPWQYSRYCYRTDNIGY